MDVVSELPSLTHAQLSEPSIQLTALPVPYTTDYTFMHNSQHTHNISMPHSSPSFLSSSQSESSGRVKKSKVTNLISILTLRPSLDYHYFLAIRSRLYTIITFSTLSGRLTLYWCQKYLPSSCPYLFFCLLSCHFSALISSLVWSWVYFKTPDLI